MRRFDSKNGLKTNEFNQGAQLKSRSGQLYFGSTAGLIGFFPGELPQNTRPPDLAVTASSRRGPITRTFSGDATPKLSVAYLDAFIAFEFVGLDFTSPDKNRYRYRMHGLDDNWAEVDNFRQAVFSALSPGNYTFEVQATNNDGVWNLEGATIDVHVVPPPWSTWWAYLFYTLAAISFVVWIALRLQAKQLAARV